MSDNNTAPKYEWSTSVNELGHLEVFLDGELVTKLQVLRDHRFDGKVPAELHLWATPRLEKKIGKRNKVWVRTYGHGQH